MDVLLFGMMRAGTTMLANLLTSLPDRLVLIEPGITRRDMGEHVLKQLQLAGLPIERDEWFAITEPMERFTRLVRPLMTGRRWGVKEVNPTGLTDLLRLSAPKRVVLIVRDIRDIAVSAIEKVQIQNTPQFNEKWIAERCLASATEIINLLRLLPSDRCQVARYEEITRDADARTSLARWLDWPLSGDPGQRLDLYNRGYEGERHGAGIGSASVGRHQDGISERQAAFISAIAQPLDFYQRYFGYR